jgi:crotonobetainyl-CoA:carnitine CoA-transferase CaiB-like acyl-CoA transferase
MTSPADRGGSAGAGPCAGLRVLEFATMVSGPFGGQLLGDLGADVIKVEPLSGDPLRSIRPAHGGMSSTFIQFNRNKRSIAVDLKSPQGVAIARELAASADIVIENNRTGVMQRLGLDYDTLRQANPAIIYASVTGFGASGPYADRLAYEHLLQAFSGVMRLQGRDGPPMGIQNVVVDKSSAMFVTNAILAALLHRERGGSGQKIDLSLMAAAASFLLPESMTNDSFLDPAAEQVKGPDTFFPVETADGHVIGYLQQRSHFVALCRVFGREDLIEDARFQTAWDIFSKLPVIWAEMQAVARDFTTAHIVEAAGREGMPLAPINSMRDFIADPQVVHGGVFQTVEAPGLGPVRHIGYPATLSESPASIRMVAPRLGEHGADILAELGRSPDDIAALREQRVIA